MKATRPWYGRRPDLEARRLLGVEAQDAGLLLRPPARERPQNRIIPGDDARRWRERTPRSHRPPLAVRAGRLRCWRAPPPGPRAGAGRCVGLGLSPAIVQCERYFPLLLMLLARALLLATSYAIGASTGQLCVQHKAMSRRGKASNALTPRTIAALARGVARELSRLRQTR